jgi:hypothetical protein
LKLYLLPEFSSYRDMTYLFGNLGIRAKKYRRKRLMDPMGGNQPI